MKYTVSTKAFYNSVDNYHYSLVFITDEENNTFQLHPVVFSKLFRQAIKLSNNVYEVNQCQENFLKKIFLYKPIMMIDNKLYQLDNRTTELYPNCAFEDDVFYVFPNDNWREKGESGNSIVEETKRRNTV